MTDTPNPENTEISEISEDTTPIDVPAAVEADLYGPIPFPEDQEPVEQVVITGTINIVLDDTDTMAPGQRFPVESVPEPLPPMTIPHPTAEMAVFPVESDEHRELRLEKESMSRSERLKRGW